MSKVVAALPGLFSESVEAKVYAVASRDYSGSPDGPPNSYPQYTEPAATARAPHTYRFTPARFWTSGFFPGSLWLLYERSAGLFGESLKGRGEVTPGEWRRLAVQWTEPLGEQRGRSDTHDLGFLFMPTFHKWARNASSEDERERARAVVLGVAEGLASRFNPYVGCTRSWDQSGHKVNGERREDMDKHFLVIIDNMMNLDLLYYAQLHAKLSSTKASNPTRLSDIATTHALTTIANHFHSDGGTYHVLNYNQTPGAEPKIIKRWAAQGYSDDSVWSRGQAWALHGYAHCAEWTDVLQQEHVQSGEELGDGNLEASWDAPFRGRMEFVERAKVAADYFIAHLGEGKEGVPPWDFDAPPNPDGSLTFRDVSAGMIAASGMLTLHCALRRIDGPDHPSPYIAAALKIVRATLGYCSTPHARFLAPREGKLERTVDLGEGGWDTILNQSTINYNENAARRWADCGLVYADYYFLEVGNKLLAMERRGWLHERDLSSP